MLKVTANSRQRQGWEPDPPPNALRSGSCPWLRPTVTSVPADAASPTGPLCRSPGDSICLSPKSKMQPLLGKAPEEGEAAGNVEKGKQLTC